MIAVWLGLLLAAGSQAADYSIAGAVVSAAGGDPVKGAEVTIVPLEHRERRALIVTDADGRFAVSGIPPGKYELSAKRRGFLAQRYDERAGLSPAIVAGPGLDTEHIVFRLSPPAVISGKVVDEAGEPVEKATIELLCSAMVQGRRRVTPFSVQITDDLGQYRFAPLPPGAYYLVVSGYPWYTKFVGALPDLMPASPTRIGYGARYYPDASDPSAAEPLSLRPGQEATANFTLLPVPAASLNLGFENGENGTKQLTLSAAGLHGNQVFVREASEGGDTYTFEAIPPGHYTLTVHITDSHPNLYARRDVEVGSTDTDVMVTLQEPPSLAGNVEWEGEGSRDNLEVVLSEEDTGSTIPVTVGIDGKFSLDALPPQRYRFSLSGADDAYLRSWSVDGARRERDGQTFDVPEGGKPVRLHLVVSKGAGHIEGAVFESDRRRSGALVVLAPAADSSTPEDYHACRTAADGSYDLRGVPPGDYALFAVEDGSDLEYSNAAAIRPYRTAARKIRVASGGSYSQRLDLTPPAVR